MFLLQPPTITAPSGQMPTQQVPQQAPQDDAISRFLSKPAASEQQSQQPTTQRSAVDEYLGSEHSGHGTTEQSSSEQSNGRAARKFTVLASDITYTGLVVKHALSAPGTSTWVSRTFDAVRATTPSAPASGSAPAATGWFASTRLGQALSKLPLIGRLGGHLCKAMPYIGGILAAIDVTSDWIGYGTMDGADDILGKELLDKNLNDEQISKAKDILAGKFKPDGSKFDAKTDTAITDTSVIDAKLKGHLKSCNLSESDVKNIVSKTRGQQKACDEKCTSATVNTVCTVGGAAIGALIGCVGGPPGAILGGFIGASIGNLVGMGVNAIRGSSGIGSFFKSFFS